jgi:hypothetical protein
MVEDLGPEPQGYSEEQARLLAAMVEYYEGIGLPRKAALEAAKADAPPDMT